MLIIYFLNFLASSAQQDWKLAWSDEFDYTGVPNPKFWGYEEGYIRGTEEQYYMVADPRNSRVENGYLTIEAHHDVNHSIGNKKYNYSSASINTLGHVHFLYGKIEASLKVPPGDGTWPALWMMGINLPVVNWPLCGEIDIMEYVGNDPETLWSTIHMDGHKPPEYKVYGTLVTEKASTVFHNYTLVWTDTAVTVYIDTHFIVEYKKPSNPDQNTWPFDLPFYVLINLAMGGGWGGEIDQSLFDSEVRYYIDYIRYYIDMNDPHHEESFKVLEESLQ